MPRRRKVSAERLPEFSRGPETRPFMAKSTAIVLGLLILAVSVTCLIQAIPEYRKLQAVEAELSEALAEEAKLKRDRLRYALESAALKTNQKYLESRSRDRLHLYMKGESVVELD